MRHVQRLAALIVDTDELDGADVDVGVERERESKLPASEWVMSEA